jgi:hypothetical protein
MIVPSPTPAGSQALWRPPPSSLFKVNWDIQMWIKSKGGLDMALLLGIMRRLSWLREALQGII